MKEFLKPRMMYKRIYDNNRRFEYLIIIILFFCIIFVQAISFINPFIGVDAAGYYINVGRDVILNNKTLYRDINCSYTPIAILFNSLPYFFNDSPGYSHFLIPINTVFWLVIFVFFGILKMYNLGTKLSVIFSLFFGMLLLNFEALYPLLELHVVLFTLIAYYLIQLSFLNSNRLFLILAGLTSFLAFWSKQNGLLIMFSFFIYLLVVYGIKTGIKKYLWLLSGFIVPVIVLIIYYNFIIDDFSAYQLMKRIVLIDDSIKVTGFGLDLHTFIFSLLYFFTRNIFFLFSIILFLIFHYKSKMLLSNCLIALISFSVLFQAHYLHYYLLIIPFTFLFSILIYNNSSDKIKKYFLLCFVLSFLFLLRPLAANIVNYNKIYNLRDDLYEESLQLIEAVPKGSKVFLFSDPRFYFLCEYKSANSKFFVYSWPELYKQEKYIFEHVEESSYLIFENYYINQFKNSPYRNAFEYLNTIPVNNEKYYEIYFKK